MVESFQSHVDFIEHFTGVPRWIFLWPGGF
jgi:hypothetical protein